MKKLTNIILASMAPITILTTASLATTGCAKDNKVSHKSMFHKTTNISNTIYTIDGSNLPDDVIVMLESLQGILAQEQARIYIYGADHTGSSGTAKKERDDWFGPFIKRYNLQTVAVTDIWGLIRLYKEEFNGKYVVYKNAVGEGDDRDWNKSINLATTVSGAEHYLMLSEDLVPVALEEIPSLEQGADARTMSSLEVFNKYKDQLNNTMLINQSPYDFPLRDYAIASKALTIYLDDEKNYMRNNITSWLQPHSPILGWNKGELDFVAEQSTHDLPVLASDHCTNLSLLSYYSPTKRYDQVNRAKVKVKVGTHYLAIVMSDGDNLQWMQYDYKFSDWYGNKHRGEFPITWTISPAALDLNADILDYFYGNMKKTDQFIAGPSGFAYANLAQYNDVKGFGDITAKYMKDLDLTCVNVLDYYDCNVNKFNDLMAQSQIKGAVWSNRDLYLSGHGSVDWINDKPIVSMREGLWNSKGQDPLDPYPYKPEKVAARINSYPKDPSTIDGYTVLIANAWSDEGKMDGIYQLTQLLDKNVELVTVDQILQLIKDNVQHVHAVPEKSAPAPVVPD